ncbi:hypothetical protein BC941DRAFT_519104 [Chlamydoabsidia padenii]|nr:hypothetical protein BC941DRAFT_519104 [Chlamydoabsidia padenii]
MELMKDQLYYFDQDDLKSLHMWITIKLSELNYDVYVNEESTFNRSGHFFAVGFQSPTQIERMQNATSFCLDATHNISVFSRDCLCILLIQDPTEALINF